MVKKYFFFLSFAILLFLISFISAGFFSDFAGKITGQVACEIPGEYDSASYCDFDGFTYEKKDSGVSCSNNYECKINSCVEGVCKSQFQEVPEQTTFLEDLWRDFLEFLGIVEDRECQIDDIRVCGTNVGICVSGTQGCTSDFVWESTCGGAYIGPSAEQCDGLDNDCDGTIDVIDGIPCEPCTPGEDRSCGTTDVGICEFGNQICSTDGFLGVCEGAVFPEAEAGDELCSDGLDNDCDGLIDDADPNCQVDTCLGTAVGCSGLPDGPCQENDQCDYNEATDVCEGKACPIWNGDELGCLSVGCDWTGTETIFCGNDNQIDPVLNEVCDGSNRNGFDCTNYTLESTFTGGALSCALDCNSFDVSQCTISYFPSDPAVSEILNGINGLALGTTVTVELLSSLPPGVDLPNKISLISIINISVDIPPPATAEILFAVNKTDINISEEGVGMYRVESDNSLANLVRTLLPDTSVAYYNYSAITEHFSVFLIVESLAFCGDDVVDPGEECDGDDNLNGGSCASKGYDAGTLACDVCFFDLSSCSLDAGNGDAGNGDDNNGGGSSSIKILVFSPREGITYSKKAVALEVVDIRGNAGFWSYILNGGAKTIFTPNTTISVQSGTNILKVLAKQNQASSYEAFNLVSFRVVDNLDASCGDNICDEGEDCGSCANDCGSCALVEGYCGDNICGVGEDSLNCPNDCEAEQKSNTGFFILLTVVILVAIALVVFFIFKKMRGSRSPSISPPPPTTPTGPCRTFFSRTKET